ncbi:hypothetical protein BRADI_3g02395v3 [Brachypodium distachyon]|uniref:Uncharacterized protein n=1 Tax=Brachypodium distachyon TaxID=15368 RepID=A0A0Q3HHW8_BRADI|nr:hypothetical protein BRADI_3g02395v3 [Brachypodium distachyon]
MAGGVVVDEQKSSWPELVGLNSVLAVIKIHGDRPDVVVEFHTAGENVPPGFDGHRVRLFLAPGTADVAQTPVVG